MDLGYPPVDPLRPLVEMAAEKVAEYFPNEEISKLAPDFVTLIKKTGVKRSQPEGSEMKNPPGPAPLDPEKKKTRETKVDEKEENETSNQGSSHSRISRTYGQPRPYTAI